MISLRAWGWLRIGRVDFHPTVWVYPVLGWLVASNTGLLAGLFCVAALIIHEAGHVIAAALAALPIERVQISMVGGRVIPAAGGTLTQRIAVSMGGPVGNLLAALPALPFVAARGFWPGDPVTIWAGAHLVLALVNLLPALPLDGGHLLLHLLEGRASHQIVAALSLIVGLGMILAGVFLMPLADALQAGIVAVGLSAAGTASHRLWAYRQRRSLVTQSAGTHPDLITQTVPPFVPAGRIRGWAAVMVEGRLLGVVTPGPYRQGQTAAHVMRPLVTIPAHTSLWAALRIMESQECEAVAVYEGERFRGLLTLAHCERAALNRKGSNDLITYQE